MTLHVRCPKCRVLLDVEPAKFFESGVMFGMPYNEFAVYFCECGTYFDSDHTRVHNQDGQVISNVRLLDLIRPVELLQ